MLSGQGEANADRLYLHAVQCDPRTIPLCGMFGAETFCQACVLGGCHSTASGGCSRSPSVCLSVCRSPAPDMDRALPPILATPEQNREQLQGDENWTPPPLPPPPLQSATSKPASPLLGGGSARAAAKDKGTHESKGTEFHQRLISFYP